MKFRTSLLGVGALVVIASESLFSAPALSQATCDSVVKCAQKAVDVAASADAAAKALQDRVNKLEVLTKQLESQTTGVSMYQCPNSDGHMGGSLGGGSWGFYGCQGQITTQSTCMVIEYPKNQSYPCTPIGKLRIAP
jgi:hypothetical protein